MRGLARNWPAEGSVWTDQQWTKRIAREFETDRLERRGQVDGARFAAREKDRIAGIESKLMSKMLGGSDRVGPLKQKTVIAVRKEVARPPNAMGRTHRPDGENPSGKRSRHAVDVKRMVRGRHHIVAKHLAADDLAKDRDPVGLGNVIGRKSKVRGLRLPRWGTF
jgi:hypothetical protein